MRERRLRVTHPGGCILREILSQDNRQHHHAEESFRVLKLTGIPLETVIVPFSLCPHTRTHLVQHRETAFDIQILAARQTLGTKQIHPSDVHRTHFLDWESIQRTQAGHGQRWFFGQLGFTTLLARQPRPQPRGACGDCQHHPRCVELLSLRCRFFRQFFISPRGKSVAEIPLLAGKPVGLAPRVA